MAETVFTDANFDAEALKAKEAVLVDFFAPWCGPCKMMSPIIDKLAEEFAGKVKIGKFNIDENQEVPTRYGIQSIPTIILLKNGEVVDKMVGFQSAEVLKNKMNDLI
jgi:thioredoxin 1